jgi:putative sterol carrier protein
MAANNVPVTLSLSDADFTKLVDGKAKAQQLFMSGKLKIKGNMMKVLFGVPSLMYKMLTQIFS